MDWRNVIVETAWRHPLLWRGLKAAHPYYTIARCRLRRRPRLRWIQLEVTNACNLACVMCGGVVSERPRGLMSREVADEVFRQVPDGSLYCVSLHCVGEPLLNPNLEAFAHQASRKARVVFLSTNGLLFRGDAELMARLLLAGVNHIHFSTEAYDAERYEATRVGGRFDEFLANLRLLRQACDRLAVDAGIHLAYTLVRPHDAEEIREVLAVFGRHVDTVEFKPLNNQGRPEIAYRRDESIRGVRCFAERRLPCLALWCGLTVLWDGRVSICPRTRSDDFVVGEARASLPDAWMGDAARRLRAAHARGRIPAACAGCSDPHARTLAIEELQRKLYREAAAGAA